MRTKALQAALLSVTLGISACAQVRPDPRADIPPQQTAQRDSRTPRQVGTDVADAIPEGTELTPKQVLERMSRLYRYQADILMAQAQNDNEGVDALFTLAMTELGRLSQQEGISESEVGPRFREVYRTLVTAYEQHYGEEADELQRTHGDIFELRADIFAALNDADRVPLLENVEIPRLRIAETVIPMPMNRLVESSIAYLLRSPERHLYRWIERSETYFPMIEQILEEEGVPDEMKYLAMIESGLNPKAASWAQAGGMWQFIRATGAAYGLQVNDWVDERMDPEKSTRAAARHLKDLYNMFGQDWHLAMAGYNCSPARIKRAIARAEQRLGRRATFWDIYDDIPRETRNYVPMFIAAAIVASNPEALDQSRITPGPRYEYDVVPVRGSLSLRRVASMAGTNEDVIRALNPELKRNATPSTNGYYNLRLPVGASRAFQQASADVRPEQIPSVTEYIVKRGDTLSRIAQRHGTTVAAIRSSNSGIGNGGLQAGQRLRIPSGTVETSGSVQVASADIRTVRYVSRPRVQIAASNNAPLPRVAQPRTPVVTASDRGDRNAEVETRSSTTRSNVRNASSSNTRVVYRVKRGDTLNKIAQRHGVTIGQLRQWNRLSGSTIQAGQRLSIYTGGSNESVAESEAPSRSTGNARVERASARESTTTHTVRRGETLTGIAQKYGVSIADLRAWNNVSGGNIQAGQRLTVRGGQVASSSSSRSSSSRATVYRVRSGDNLTEIARRHGVSVSDLRRWNNLRGSKITVGQRLRVSG